MFSWLRRLFGRSAAPTASEATDPFQDRLADFVSSADAAPVTAEPAKEKTGSREMIEAARQTVETVESYFRTYVADRILKRFGNDFRVETPTSAQTRDLDARFGDAKTGNEYRYVQVAFKDRFALILRVQAMILSRGVQVKVMFRDVKNGTHVTRELDLSPYGSLSSVAWDREFEAIFVAYFDWSKSL